MKKLLALLCFSLLLVGMGGFAPPALAVTGNEYDENDSRIAYAGFSLFDIVTGSYRQTVHSANGAGNLMKATFTNCTYIELYGGKSSDKGSFKVYIDGVMVDTINTYSAKQQVCTLLFRADGLAKGTHTLTVETERNWTEVDKLISDGDLVQSKISLPDPEEGNQIIDDTRLGYTGTWSKYSQLDAGRLFYNNTATSTQTKGAQADYTFAYCTGIKWYSTSNSSYGLADVYIDGEFAQTVDTAALNRPPCAVFDSGPLPAGQHSIRIVTKNEGQKYVEIDRIIGVGANEAGYWIANNTDTLLLRHTGLFETVQREGALNGDCLQTNRPGSELILSFYGTFAKLYGIPDAGKAEVTVDGKPAGTVDFGGIHNGLLYEAAGLADGLHTITLRLTEGKLLFDYAQVEELTSVFDVIYQAANEELEIIRAGEKTVLQQSGWNPVNRAASMPVSGVTLDGGVFKTAFDRNISYIKYCFTKEQYVDMSSIWITALDASNQGRMLSGAGNSLRWTEDAKLREILNTLIEKVKTQKKDNGFCLPYDESRFALTPGNMTDEDKNYDRVMFTKGLLAAGKAGNPDAYGLLRGMYDWFNTCEYLPVMLDGGLGVQGAAGGPLVYDSPVGKPEDIYTNMKYYDMDWWMEYLALGRPEAIYRYPLNRPHGYLLTSISAYLDEYRATGEEKYLRAVLGGWNIFHENFVTTGGGICICEGPEYLPKNYTLNTTNGVYENCNNVFWVDLNSRLLELFPEEEKYAAEVERALYNMLLASQDTNGKIRYFQLYNGKKTDASAFNTCCEIQGTGQLASLPQYIYSVAQDGLYLNLYAASTIKATANGQAYELAMQTEFPDDRAVSLRFSATRPVNMKLRIRIPSWAAGEVDIMYNGKNIAAGQPGSYVTLDKTFQEGDVIAFTLPMTIALHEYMGESQIAGEKRYALTYGPILLAAKGVPNANYKQHGNQPVLMLPVWASELTGLLQKGEGLTFSIAGVKGYTFVPYYSIQNQYISVFPVLHGAGAEPTKPPEQATPTKLPAQPSGRFTQLLLWGLLGAFVLAGIFAGGILLRKRAKNSKPKI